MLDFVAVGDVMLDVLAPAARTRRTHGPIRVRVGGSAANAARQAVAEGARALVVGRVGDDPAGRLIADELLAAGIDAVLARDPERPTGTVVAVGEAIVADRGANAGFALADVPDVLAARVVLVSGYLLFQSDSGPAAAAALERADGLTAVDLAAPGLATTAPIGAVVVLGTGDGFAALTGCEPLEAVRVLADRGHAACATLGADGAVAARDGELESVRPARRLAGDPLGAGDAFAAAFLLALADGTSLRAALERGCAAGGDA